MSQVTEHNGVRPGDPDQPEDEAVLPEDPFAQDRKQQLQAAVGAGVFAALVALVLWRLKLRRTPPTPTERLTDAARSLGESSLAFGGRAADRVSTAAAPAVERVSDTAVPAAQRLASAAVPVAERAAELALEGLNRGAEGAGELAIKAAELGGVAVDVGEKVGTVTVATAQKVGSGIAEVPDVVADVATGVHKFWRKWTLRILVLVAAALGYTAGAAAGRERYEQIVGTAKTVAARPEVQSAQQKVMGAVMPDHGNPTV